MHKLFSSFALATALLAAALPAVAGNYAEGDPRPDLRPSQGTTADVRAETRQWLATAPTVGYPEGEAKAAALPRQKTRAQVQAEAVDWVRSGMVGVTNGEVPFDSRGPSYEQAVKAFDDLRAGRQEAVVPSSSVAR